MKKTVIVSTNENHSYLFFLPLVCLAWKKLGWNVHCIYTGDIDNESFVLAKRFSDCTFSYIQKPFNVMRNETLTQVSRLYAAEYLDGYLMTSDIDMLPLSNYWRFDENKITCWGRDLSDRHYPICYIGASQENWKLLMGGCNMENDLEKNIAYKSEIFSEWWQVDQDIVTNKIDNLLEKNLLDVKPRGIAPNTHYPLGRIDRGNWTKTLEQPERIDAHLLRPGFVDDNWFQILNLVSACFGLNEDEINELEKYKNLYAYIYSRS